jgi:hypothetical protein
VRFTFTHQDIKDLAINAGLVGLAAALTYAAEWAGTADLGSYGPLVVAGISIALKAVNNWIRKSPDLPVIDGRVSDEEAR